MASSDEDEVCPGRLAREYLPFVLARAVAKSSKQQADTAIALDLLENSITNLPQPPILPEPVRSLEVLQACEVELSSPRLPEPIELTPHDQLHPSSIRGASVTEVFPSQLVHKLMHLIDRHLSHTFNLLRSFVPEGLSPSLEEDKLSVLPPAFEPILTNKFELPEFADIVVGTEWVEQGSSDKQANNNIQDRIPPPTYPSPINLLEAEVTAAVTAFQSKIPCAHSRPLWDRETLLAKFREQLRVKLARGREVLSPSDEIENEQGRQVSGHETVQAIIEPYADCPQPASPVQLETTERDPSMNQTFCGEDLANRKEQSEEFRVELGFSPDQFVFDSTIDFNRSITENFGIYQAAEIEHDFLDRVGGSEESTGGFASPLETKLPVVRRLFWII